MALQLIVFGFLSKRNCGSFPDQDILKRFSNMSFEWTWFEGLSYQNIGNKITWKVYSDQTGGSRSLLRDTTQAKWYVYAAKKKYSLLFPLSGTNTDNLLVILKCYRKFLKDGTDRFPGCYTKWLPRVGSILFYQIYTECCQIILSLPETLLGVELWPLGKPLLIDLSPYTNPNVYKLRYRGHESQIWGRRPIGEILRNMFERDE